LTRSFHAVIFIKRLHGVILCHAKAKNKNEGNLTQCKSVSPFLFL